MLTTNVRSVHDKTGLLVIQCLLQDRYFQAVTKRLTRPPSITHKRGCFYRESKSYVIDHVAWLAVFCPNAQSYKETKTTFRNFMANNDAVHKSAQIHIQCLH